MAGVARSQAPSPKPTVKRMVVRSVALIALLVCGAGRADAQTPSDAAVVDWTITPYVGVARGSPVGSSWSVLPDRNYLFLGVQFETSVLRVGALRLLYAPNFTPFIRLTHTPGSGSQEVREAPAIGLGAAPFGLALKWPLSSRVAVFSATAIGALWFERPVPVPLARVFNVTVEWGGGMDFPAPGGGVMRVGYKFHHLSNVFTALENPGVDGHVFYGGWQWRVRARR